MRAGRVTVAGRRHRSRPATSAPDDAVALDGSAVTREHARVVYAVNKPAGVVSTARDPQGRPTVVSLVPSDARLYPVGRLDIDTTGLILLTNDGELAHRLTHPRFEVAKTYRAIVCQTARVARPALRALRDGVELDDGRTAPARVRRIAPTRSRSRSTRAASARSSGCASTSAIPSRRLERIRFGPLELGDLRARRLPTAERARR